MAETIREWSPDGIQNVALDYLAKSEIHGKSMKSKIAIAAFSLVILSLFAISWAEEFYRSTVFVENVKRDFLSQAPIQNYLDNKELENERFENYFVFGALSSDCQTPDNPCFSWRDYPNVDSVVTYTPFADGPPGYILFRNCAERDCAPFAGGQLGGHALDQAELSAAMQMTKSTESCQELEADKYTFLPITYRTSFCERVTRIGTDVVSVNFRALVGRPHFLAFKSSHWFREEATISINFANGEIKTHGISERDLIFAAGGGEMSEVSGVISVEKYYDLAFASYSNALDYSSLGDFAFIRSLGSPGGGLFAVAFADQHSERIVLSIQGTDPNTVIDIVDDITDIGLLGTWNAGSQLLSLSKFATSLKAQGPTPAGVAL